MKGKNVGDFFDMTVGRIMGNSRAHVRLTPAARAAVLEQCECTDAKLDAALEELGRQMTEQAHSDMAALRQRTARQQAELLAGLIAKKKGERNDPDEK